MEEQKKLKKKINDILYYLFILIIIALCIYLFFYIRSESYECMNSPMTYGIKHLSSSSNNEITCTCGSLGVQQRIYITKDNISFIKV